jgi:hypothetical protein
MRRMHITILVLAVAVMICLAADVPCLAGAQPAEQSVKAMTQPMPDTVTLGFLFAASGVLFLSSRGRRRHRSL